MTRRSEAEMILALVEADDRRVQAPRPVETPAHKVAWLCSRSPFFGGEYYRATRPAALAARNFGWHTLVGQKAGEVEGGPPRVVIAGPRGQLAPDVLVLRPLGQTTDGSSWALSDLVDRAHRAGQRVIADLDDDLWAHEDWTPSTRPEDDQYETWCWKADGWLCSTEVVADRVRSLLRRDVPVAVAPNCYDYHGFHQSAGPIPGRRLGTRLWLSGRMSGDRRLYEQLVGPLLAEPPAGLGCTFVQVGADDGGEPLALPPGRVLRLPSVDLLRMGAILAATVSIGVVCADDHPYNRAKTLTHPVELASAGLPLVVASDLDIYREVPGQVAPEIGGVRERVALLLDPEAWAAEAAIAADWAYRTALDAELAYLAALDLVASPA